MPAEKDLLEARPPTPCRTHGALEVVFTACTLAQAGQDSFGMSLCPRCAFEQYRRMVGGVIAVWDGSTWQTDELSRRFISAWIDQSRDEGLIAGEVPAGLAPPTAPDHVASVEWPVEWALRLLHPDLSEQEAHIVHSVWDAERRYLRDPLPYADITERLCRYTGTEDGRAPTRVDYGTREVT